jgi:hypothetical protein
MKRVTDELRAAYQSLSEVEGDQPGHDYDRGYCGHIRKVGRLWLASAPGSGRAASARTIKEAKAILARWDQWA